MKTVIGTLIVLGLIFGALLIWYLIGCLAYGETPFKKGDNREDSSNKIGAGAFITIFIAFIIIIGWAVGRNI